MVLGILWKLTKHGEEPNVVYVDTRGITIVCERCRVQFRLGCGPRSLGNLRSFLEAFEERHPSAMGCAPHSRSKFIKFGYLRKRLERYDDLSDSP